MALHCGEIPHGVIATADGVVYVGGYDKKVRALGAADGELIWEHKMSRSAIGGVTLAEDALYVANTESQVVALNMSTGQELWVSSFRQPATATRSACWTRSPANCAGAVNLSAIRPYTPLLYTVIGCW